MRVWFEEEGVLLNAWKKMSQRRVLVLLISSFTSLLLQFFNLLKFEGNKKKYAEITGFAVSR